MAMSERINVPSKPIVGERYTVNSISIREVEDKYNGGTRPLLILYTDKGAIYATNGMAKEALADPDDARDTLVGTTLLAVEYFNKRAGRNLIGFTMI